MPTRGPAALAPRGALGVGDTAACCWLPACNSTSRGGAGASAESRADDALLRATTGWRVPSAMKARMSLQAPNTSAAANTAATRTLTIRICARRTLADGATRGACCLVRFAVGIRAAVFHLAVLQGARRDAAVAGHDFDVAGDLATRLDLNLAVVDLAVDAAGAAH